MRTRTWLALPVLALGTWGFTHAQDIEGWAEQVRAANEGTEVEVVVAVASHP